MNIVVSNVKGGVGKTTTSVYLAAAAVARGWAPVTLVDADRQASTAEWLEVSPIEGVDLVEAPSERTVNRALASHGGLAVVDTPPATNGSCGRPFSRPTPWSCRPVLAGWSTPGWSPPWR